MSAATEQAMKALAVIATDIKIRETLNRIDPKALEQVDTALEPLIEEVAAARRYKAMPETRKVTRCDHCGTYGEVTAVWNRPNPVEYKWLCDKDRSLLFW